MATLGIGLMAFWLLTILTLAVLEGTGLGKRLEWEWKMLKLHCKTMKRRSDLRSRREYGPN